MRITIEGKLATLNQHDRANRANRFVGAKLKLSMTELVQMQALGNKPVDKPCVVSFTWYYSGREDFDNIAFAKKYVLDGLVKAGVLHDDNQRWVTGFNDSFIKVAKGLDKVTVDLQ